MRMTVRRAPSTRTLFSSDILAAGITHKHILPYCRIPLGTLEIKFLLHLYQSLALAYCLEQYGDATNISPVNLDWTFRTLISLNSSLLTTSFVLSGWRMVRAHAFWAPRRTDSMLYWFREKVTAQKRTSLVWWRVWLLLSVSTHCLILVSRHRSHSLLECGWVLSLFLFPHKPALHLLEP